MVKPKTVVYRPFGKLPGEVPPENAKDKIVRLILDGEDFKAGWSYAGIEWPIDAERMYKENWWFFASQLVRKIAYELKDQIGLVELFGFSKWINQYMLVEAAILFIPGTGKFLCTRMFVHKCRAIKGVTWEVEHFIYHGSEFPKEFVVFVPQMLRKIG